MWPCLRSSYDPKSLKCLLSGYILLSNVPLLFQRGAVFTIAPIVKMQKCHKIVQYIQTNGYPCSSWKNEVSTPIVYHFNINFIANRSFKVNITIKGVIIIVRTVLAHPALYSYTINNLCTSQWSHHV